MKKPFFEIEPGLLCQSYSDTTLGLILHKHLPSKTNAGVYFLAQVLHSQSHKGFSKTPIWIEFWHKNHFTADKAFLF